MDILKRTGTLCLLAIFIFAITGMSVFRHTCHSSNEENVSLYVGIFTEAPASCCDDAEMEMKCFASGSQPLAVEETTCCESTTAFLSLKVTTERQEKLVIRHENVLPKMQMLPLSQVVLENRSFTTPVFCQFHPPPLSGKRLVHFLHRIKIPAHPDLA